MNRRMFTKEQINELLKNPHVERCSEKTITYSNDFKVAAVRQHLEYHMSVKDIFISAGFDLAVIGVDTPHWCLKRWDKIYQTRGLERLARDTRGRPVGQRKTERLSAADRIKRLETENAYLRAENDFLAELRAKRAE